MSENSPHEGESLADAIEALSRAMVDELEGRRAWTDGEKARYARVISALGEPEARRRIDALTRAARQAKLEEALALKAAARRASPFVVCRQHAVGHGGFHTGALGPDEPIFRWIYDCGAWRKSGKLRLQAHIDVLARQIGPAGLVGLLFLSHFDADHVSGVRHLLRRTRVDTVVVPYLEPEDWVCVVAEAAVSRARRRDIEALVEALVRPELWFGGRGVRRVVRLRPGSSPPERLGSRTEAGPAAPGDSPQSPARAVLVANDGTALPDLGGYGQVIEAQPGVVGRVFVAGVETDWSFVPFVHPVSEQARARLRSAAEALVGTALGDPSFGDDLVALVRAKDGLRRLREIYVDRELADANGKSLSLYQGPLLGDLRRDLNGGQRGPGWLLTGDAKLRSPFRRAAWLHHYGPIPPHLIGRLMVPHHGAAGNFHLEVARFAERAQLFITAEDGDPLRPHEDVVGELEAAGDPRPIHVVTAQDERELWASSGAEEYGRDPLFSDGRLRSWT